MSSHTYTGSGNIAITNSQISLKFPIKINNEIVLHPRLNGYFGLHAGASGVSFLQNIANGSQPTAIFNSSNKSLYFLLRS